LLLSVETPWNDYIFPPTGLQAKQMKFKKQILRPGVYYVNDGNNGRRLEYITAERLKHWADQHKKMVKAGLHVPAPAVHKKDANPTNSQKTSKDNFGWWEQIDFTGEALEGVVNIPVQSDQERIGKTVKEVSIYAKPKFVDGLGNEWNDVLTHIAIVTNPIEPNQKNFEKLEEGSLAVAMSDIVSMSDSQLQELDDKMKKKKKAKFGQQDQKPSGQQGDEDMSDDMDDEQPDDMDEDDDMTDEGDEDQADMDPLLDQSSDIFTLLQEIAGIAIPKGTPDIKLKEVLTNALLQKQLSERKNRSGGTIKTPPANSKVNEVPVVMSNNNNGTAGGNQPSGSQTETVSIETVMSHPSFKAMESQNKGILGVLTNSKKQELRSRLNALRQRNIISTDEDLKNYNQQVEALSMSFGNDGNPLVTPIEVAVSALESVKIPMPASQPIVAMAQVDASGNFVIQPQQVPTGGPLTDARAEEIVKGLFGSTSV
jgi:hypothetical protein